MAFYYDLVMAKALREAGILTPENAAKFWSPTPELSEEDEWKEVKQHFYNTPFAVICEGGIVDFSKEEYANTVRDRKLSYNEYLDIAHASLSNIRTGLETVYYDYPIATFKGVVETVNDNGKVCFKRIYISAFDEKDGIVEKEDHVLMKASYYPQIEPGLCLSFSAEVYRYLRHNNTIDYGLRNPTNIEIIEEYKLPTDDELLKREIDQTLCSNCMYHSHCNGTSCIANEYKHLYQRRTDCNKTQF